MKYIYTSSPVEQAAIMTANTIKDHLSRGEHVLWLLSGGSGVPIATKASEKLQDADLSNLSVSMTDERFVPVGHPDENWQQLIDTGLKLPGADLYRPLSGKSVDKTVTDFNSWLVEHFEKADFKIGIFGMGTDGHTAGIKPHSSATITPYLATSFVGDDFERVTISFNAIRQLDEAIIQASGDCKQLVLHDLLYESKPLNEQPVQILKTIPRTTLYSNNNKEDIK